MKKWLNVLVCLSIVMSLLPPRTVAYAATPTPVQATPVSPPATPTPTEVVSAPTATATASPTATAEEEITPLPTYTAVVSPTISASATLTPTISFTPTETVEVTSTPTAVVTVTATVTATPAATITETASITAPVIITGSGKIDHMKGGVLRSDDRRVSVTLGPGVAKREITASIKILDSFPHPSAGWDLFQVFDLEARHSDDGSEVTRFERPVTITVSYAQLAGYAVMQDSLTILYWNPAEKRWDKVLTKVDKDKKTLTATVEHFSGYAGGANADIQPPLPGVEAFQNDLFTGSSNATYQLEVPPGRGGLTPPIKLSYSSAAATTMASAGSEGDAGLGDSQSSWVGAGWSLEMGRIVRDMSHTGAGSQDHYLLSMDGVGDELVLGGDGYYHTKSESYVRVSRSSANTETDSWYVWTKDGTKYSFEKRLGYRTNNWVDWEEIGGVTHYIYERLIREWFVTKIEDVSGNVITISYQDDTAKDTMCNWVNKEVLGTYPYEVTYSENGSNSYKVRFNLAGRYDIKDRYNDWCNSTPHQRKRLDYVEVLQVLGGASTVIRKYQLSFDYSLFPNVRYTGYDNNPRYGKLTLRTITEKDAGNNPLPAYSFDYQDSLLKTAGNGYGGKVNYAYDKITAGRWRSDEKITYVDDKFRVYSDDTYSGVLYPGSVYTIEAQLVDNPGQQHQLYAQDNYHTQLLDQITLPNPIPPGGVRIRGAFTLDPRASYLKVYVTPFTEGWNVQLLEAFYWRTQARVTAKGVSDGLGSVLTTTYSYTDAVMNDAYHSAAIRGGSTYPKENTQFRGHASVDQADPLGNKTVSYFWQDDILKGKPRRGETYQGSSTLMQKGENTFVGGVYRAQVTTNGVAADHYTNQSIVLEEGLSLPVATGTYLEYAIKAGQSSYLRASVQVEFSDGTNSWNMSAQDQEGLSGGWTTDLNSRYAGYWYRRKISLSAFAGKTISKVLLMTNDSPTITTGQATHTYYVSSVIVGDRPISMSTRSGTGYNVTSWVIEPNPGESTSYPFVRLAETNAYAYDEGQSTYRKTRAGYNYDGYGNVISEYLYGDVGDTSDDRTVHHSYTTRIDSSTYIVDRLRWDNFYRGIRETNDGIDITGQNKFHYDGSPAYGTIVNKGLLTRALKGLPGEYVSTWEYAYDSYGNRIRTTEPSGNIITTTYDATFKAYPAATTSLGANGVTQRASSVINYRYGKPEAAVDDSNGVTVTYGYDGFGRTTKVWGPAESTSVKPTVQITITDGITGTPTKVLVERRTDMGGTSTPALYREWSFYDGLGRLIQSQSDAEEAGQVIVKSLAYDTLGRKEKESVPITTTNGGAYITPTWTSLQKTAYAYDSLGRTTFVTNTDGTVLTTTYTLDGLGAGAVSDAFNSGRGYQKKVVDPNGHEKYYTYDALNRLAWVGERAAGACSATTYVTTYQYDTLDNLLGVKSGGTLCDANYSAATIATTMTYDSQGRKTSMIDPDMGAWSYVYDPAGNLIQQTDAKGQKLRFAYDNLNRLVAKYDNTAFSTITTYDSVVSTSPDGREYAGSSNVYASVSAPAAGTYDLSVTLHEESNSVKSVPLTDGFVGLDSSLWTYSAYQSTTTIDGQTVLRSVGTGSNYNSVFYRNAYSLAAGDVVQIDFKADNNYPRSYFIIKSETGPEQFGIWYNGGVACANYVDAGGTNNCSTNLLTMEVNVWYTLRITLNESSGFVVELWKRDNPAVRGSFTRAMSSGLKWLFRHYIYYAVNMYMDNYVETYARPHSSLYRVYVDGNVVGTVTTKEGWGPPFTQNSSRMLGPSQTERFRVSLTQGQHTVRIERVAGASVRTAKDGSEIALIRGNKGSFFQYDSHLLDRFDNKDSSIWTYSAGQSVAIVDNQSVLNSVGPGSSFQRKEASLKTGDRVQFELKSGSTSPSAYFYVEGGGQPERFGVFLGSGSIQGAYFNGSSWSTSSILSLEANAWYVVSIALRDDTGFTLDVWKRDNPSVKGKYTRAMSTGLNWRFEHDLDGSATVSLDNYAETYQWAAGKRTKMVDGTGSATYYYDKKGGLAKEDKVVGVLTYTTSYVYDAMGRVATATYPDSEVLTSTYNSQALLSRLSSSLGADYLSSQSYNALGQPKVTTFGNNAAKTEYKYYGDGGPASPASFRLGEINSYIPGGSTLQKFAYEYDPVGNITKISDHLNDYDGITETQTYAYDGLDRLLSAMGSTQGTPVYTQTFSYNSIGNMLSMATNYVTNTYTYSTTKPHAVRSISGGSNNTYEYDANGNTLSGAGRSIFWDAENRPISITLGGITTTFGYDGDGKRVKKAESNGSTVTTTHYVGNYFEQVLVNDVVTETVKYYYASGKRIAMSRNGTLSYIFSDHLGGTSVVSSTVSGTVSMVGYYPFGARRSSTGDLQTDRLYTRQRWESSTGLYDYGARLYDPLTGRFLSPDPIVPSFADSQSFNRYSYALNNPLRYADPTGHNPLAVVAAIAFGIAAGFGANDVINSYYTANLDPRASMAEREEARYNLGSYMSTAMADGPAPVADFAAVLLAAKNGAVRLTKGQRLAQDIAQLAEAKGIPIQGSLKGFVTRLQNGRAGAAFQAQRTKNYSKEIVGMEFREDFGDAGGGVLDILLTGNRVIDTKDWSGWSDKSDAQKARMLGSLGDQARKCLSKDGYTLKFEFKGQISDEIREVLEQLKDSYSGRLDWESGL